ncbi:unnamed protein product [Closterium sp. NIES-54]
MHLLNHTLLFLWCRHQLPPVHRLQLQLSLVPSVMVSSCPHPVRNLLICLRLPSDPLQCHRILPYVLWPSLLPSCSHLPLLGQHHQHMHWFCCRRVPREPVHSPSKSRCSNRYTNFSCLSLIQSMTHSKSSSIAPRGSSIPLPFLALDTPWHSHPATNRSTCPHSLTTSGVISLTSFTTPRIALSITSSSSSSGFSFCRILT